MALTPEQVGDLVTTTLPLFKKYKWTDISLQHQEYVSATLLDEKKVTEAGGPYISFRVQVKNTGNAVNTGFYAQDKTGVEDVMISGQVPWALQTTSFSYDVREPLFQSDQETIIKELVIRDHDAMNSMAELTEENFWNAPTDPTDTRPMGIPFWLQMNTAEGFNGGNPSNFPAGCAGIDSTVYPRWRNWTFQYATVSTDDLVRKVKKAVAFMTFRAPVPHPELGFGKVDYQVFTTYRVTEPMERLAETRNDNLGSDLARYQGTVTIGGVPIKWVPYLEANATNDPLYGVNWKAFRPYVKKGLNMYRNPPAVAPFQHAVRNVFIDNGCNFYCVNRRLCWTGTK